MYFKASFRYNPKTEKTDWYYRLVESYRNALDEVRQRTILSVGFLDELTGDQIELVQDGLNNRIKGQTHLFKDAKADEYVELLYNRLISEKRIDSTGKGKDYDIIDLNSIKNKQVREVGSEWMSL
ncbi:MAG: transposase, partial [Bacteroidota bacterium]